MVSAADLESRPMRTITRTAAALLLLYVASVAAPSRAQTIAIGDMPQPARSGNALRFQNANATAVVTALSPEVIRVRITPAGRDGRDHSYAVRSEEHTSELQ